MDLLSIISTPDGENYSCSVARISWRRPPAIFVFPHLIGRTFLVANARLAFDIAVIIKAEDAMYSLFRNCCTRYGNSSPGGVSETGQDSRRSSLAIDYSSSLDVGIWQLTIKPRHLRSLNIIPVPLPSPPSPPLGNPFAVHAQAARYWINNFCREFSNIMKKGYVPC